MDRIKWEKQLLENVFCFYNKDIERAAEHILVGRTPTSVAYEISEVLALFFGVDVDNNDDAFFNLMIEYHRLKFNASGADVSRPEVVFSLPIDSNVALHIPRNYAEILLYIGYAHKLKDTLRSESDEYVIAKHRLLEKDIERNRRDKRQKNGEVRDRFAFFNTLKADADWDFWLCAGY